MERLLEKNIKNRENIYNKWINYFDTWNLSEFDFEAVEDLEDFILDLKKHDEFEKADEDGFSIIAMWNWERKNYFIKE